MLLPLHLPQCTSRLNEHLRHRSLVTAMSENTGVKRSRRRCRTALAPAEPPKKVLVGGDAPERKQATEKAEVGGGIPFNVATTGWKRHATGKQPGATARHCNRPTCGTNAAAFGKHSLVDNFWRIYLVMVRLAL